MLRLTFGVAPVHVCPGRELHLVGVRVLWVGVRLRLRRRVTVRVRVRVRVRATVNRASRVRVRARARVRVRARGRLRFRADLVVRVAVRADELLVVRRPLQRADLGVITR